MTFDAHEIVQVPVPVPAALCGGCEAKTVGTAQLENGQLKTSDPDLTGWHVIRKQAAPPARGSRVVGFLCPACGEKVATKPAAAVATPAPSSTPSSSST